MSAVTTARPDTLTDLRRELGLPEFVCEPPGSAQRLEHVRRVLDALWPENVRGDRS